jgi:phage FluMu gp28-like protein
LAIGGANVDFIEEYEFAGDVFDIKGESRFIYGRHLIGHMSKEQDYSAFAVIEQLQTKCVLRHIKVWPLDTKYATVIGYVKTLTDRWRSIEKIRADITGVGNYIVEDMKNGDIEGVEGVNFSHQRKQEIASLFRQRLLSGAFTYPYTDIHVSPTKKLNLSVELNTERFELRKDGTYRFFHPENQHDDVFWAIGLALFATVEMAPEPYVAILTGR